MSSEATGKQSTGGATNFVVSKEGLDLFDFSNACDGNRNDPDCRKALYLADRDDDHRVHSAYVTSGGVEGKAKVRPTDGQPGANDDFWREAQQKMDAAHRIYTTLIDGLGEALKKHGSYDPTQRTFKNGNQDIAVSCRAEHGAIVELTLAHPTYDILIDITDRAALAVFDGKLSCKKPDR